MRSLSSSIGALVACALTLVQRGLAFGNGTCYDPTGAAVEGFFACAPNYISQCCPVGWTCYSNSLCVVTDPATANATFPIGTSIRGACTNPLWNSAICGDFCLHIIDAGGALDPCGNNEFCCAKSAAQGLCNCETGNNTFSIAVGEVQTIISETIATATQTPIVTPSRSHGSVTATTTATGTQSAGSTDTARPAKVTNTNKFKIGLGVGLASLVVIVVAVVAVILIQRRHRGSNAQEMTQPEPPLIPVASSSNIQTSELETNPAAPRQPPSPMVISRSPSPPYDHTVDNRLPSVPRGNIIQG